MFAFLAILAEKFFKDNFVVWVILNFKYNDGNMVDSIAKSDVCLGDIICWYMDFLLPFLSWSCFNETSLVRSVTYFGYRNKLWSFSCYNVD